MTASSDVREILELEGDSQEFMTKDALFNADQKKKKPRKSDVQFKRPEGMHRELWGLLWTDNIGWNTFSGDAPPIIPTDTHQGYKQMKAKIGRSRVRPWKWMPFTNPARKDGAVFYHWRRAADEGKDYPFAKFNKSVEMPTYSDMEYQTHLHDENWSRQETDYLFEMCKRFDLRFIIISDRWDREQYPKRSTEDIKERYYNICNILTKARAPSGLEPKIKAFDADHERMRKEQLNKLFSRTPEQIEEEQYLLGELKKIEMRKKEREKKTQDLQKLITAADTNMESRRAERKATKKKMQEQRHKQRGSDIGATPEPTGIKFADFKQSGVSLRGQRMKLPGSVGQKKSKAIEQVLDELGIELNPIPTEDIVTHFNELRQDIVLLYELKLALANCEYELQTLRHRFETVAPGKMPDLGLTAVSTPETPSTPLLAAAGDIKIESPTKVPKKISETIDVVGTTPITPNRKRRAAALEQTNILKKLKKS